MTDQPPEPGRKASVSVNRLLSKGIAVGYAVLLAVVSLLPGSQLPTIPDWSQLFSPDKVAHFGAYALFALLLSVCTSKRGSRRSTVKAVIAAAAYGALLEVLQGIAGTGRQFDLVDMVANTLGAVIGGIFWRLLHYLINRLWPRPKTSE